MSRSTQPARSSVRTQTRLYARRSVPRLYRRCFSRRRLCRCCCLSRRLRSCCRCHGVQRCGRHAPRPTASVTLYRRRRSHRQLQPLLGRTASHSRLHATCSVALPPPSVTLPRTAGMRLQTHGRCVATSHALHSILPHLSLCKPSTRSRLHESRCKCPSLAHSHAQVSSTCRLQQYARRVRWHSVRTNEHCARCPLKLLGAALMPLMLALPGSLCSTL